MGVVTYRSWFPAGVLLPDKQVLLRCRVYATDAGLRVYSTRPTDGETASWESPIDFTITTVPDVQARHTGIDIHTEAGLVVVTPMGGCGCGSSLKRWKPSWAHTTAAWPTRVAA
jgi:hypothetical protein